MRQCDRCTKLDIKLEEGIVGCKESRIYVDLLPEDTLADIFPDLLKDCPLDKDGFRTRRNKAIVRDLR